MQLQKETKTSRTR